MPSRRPIPDEMEARRHAGGTGIGRARADPWRRYRGPMRSGRPVHPLAGLLVCGLLVLAVSGCTGEEAVPIDPANPPTTAPDLTDVTHAIEPTDEMREAASRQCLDDPDLAEGYVRAVDPQTEAVLAELTVDCVDVRADAPADADE